MKPVAHALDFRNETDRAWTLVLYRTVPSSTGLDSVPWKEVQVGTGRPAGLWVDARHAGVWWVALVDDVEVGEAIAGNVVVGPKAVWYPAGVTDAVVTAQLEENEVRLIVEFPA